MGHFKPLAVLLVLFLAGWSSAAEEEEARLAIYPAADPISAPAGKGFALTCNQLADNTEHFSDLKWTGPRGDIDGTSSNVLTQRGATQISLIFQSPSVQDSGTYNCTAWYDKTLRLNTAVNLIFFQDVSWDDCPQVQALVVGEDGKIRCRVSANPPAAITWMKNSAPLPPRYALETDGLKVPQANDADKGIYSVRAMVAQTGLFHDRIIKVEVHVPPEIIELEDRFEATEGEKATIRCQAVGFPQPTYSWLDPRQRNLSQVEGFGVDTDTGTLTIERVQSDSAGAYTCKAKNPAGDITKRIDLSVLVKPVVRTFNNQTVVEGRDVTFECRASGDPLPELNIRKEGQDRPFQPSDERVSVNRRTSNDEAILTLAISRVLRTDDGLYYCSADSRAGVVERAGHLTVEFAPVLSNTPSTSVKTWSGHTVNVSCVAEAIPNATVTWSLEGRQLQDDSFYTIHGRTGISNLEVRPTSNNVFGIYKCEAANQHGTQHINIELQEARVPGMVTELRILKTTATTVTFDVVPPSDDGGLPVRSYTVKSWEEGAEEAANLDAWNEGGPYTQEKLRPRAVYRFSVSAANEAGAGPYSDERRVSMPAESAPEPPRLVAPRNTSTYADRFTLRWTVPEDNGRAIDLFELRYFQAEKREGAWRRVGETEVREVRRWENSPQLEMRGLRPATHYKVEVRAHNAIGFSQDATMVFLTAAGAEQGHMSGDMQNSGGSGGLSTGGILAIVIVLALVVLIVVDLTCFVRYRWGLLFLLRSRVCAPTNDQKAKEAAFDDSKGGKGDNEKKTRSEVDNPAFDKEKQPLAVFRGENVESAEAAREDTPMISARAKDAKPQDDLKNKSPKGSRSSIAKDSLV